MALPKNLGFVLKRLHKFIFFEVLIFSIVCISVFSFPDAWLSFLVGALFSLFVFIQSIKGQQAVLAKKNKGVFFVYYIFRLPLYAIPLILGLYFENYFNFYIVLVFLFSYQVHFIGFEFFRSLKKYKRQRNGWTS